MRKQYVACWDTPNQWRRDPTQRRKINFFQKKNFNKQRGEKYKRKYFQKPSPRKHRFFRKAVYCLVGKITVSIGRTEKQDIMQMNAKIGK